MEFLNINIATCTVPFHNKEIITLIILRMFLIVIKKILRYTFIDIIGQSPIINMKKCRYIIIKIYLVLKLSLKCTKQVYSY